MASANHSQSWVFLALLMPTTLVVASPAATCDPADPAFICGVSHSEDLVRVPGTPWIVASQLNMDVIPSDPTQFHYLFGPVVAIRTDTREVRTLYPAPESGTDWDRNNYPDCHAPPAQLTSHGVNVRALAPDRFRLYVVNHGNRESIEAIDVADIGAKLKATWRGCILVSKEKWGLVPNGVAPLADGGLIIAGSGGVATWHTDRGIKRIANIPGSNGVEVSRDGRSFIVADSGTQSLVQISAETGAVEATVSIDVIPDNLRWGDDGYLYVAGPQALAGTTMQDGIECIAKPVCSSPFTVARIDTREFTVQEIFRSSDKGLDGLFGNGATALQIGDRLWIGTVRGDRIAIMPLPAVHNAAPK